MKVFSPSFGNGQTIAVTTSSASAAIGVASDELVLTNLTSEPVYVRTGDSAAVATAADYCVGDKGQITIRKLRSHTHVAVLTAAGTSDLHVIPGEGA